MEKFDPIKMAELVSVKEDEDGRGLTLIFQDGKSVRITVVEDRLVSEVADAGTKDGGGGA